MALQTEDMQASPTSGRRDYVSKSDSTTEAALSPISPRTAGACGLTRFSSATPESFPQRNPAALLRSATFVKSKYNVIFQQHFATALFKRNHRNLHTLNDFGAKELNTSGPRPFGGQPQA